MSRRVDDNHNLTNREVLLYDFDTGSARLQPEHIAWLQTFANEHVLEPRSLWVIGIASRVGDENYNFRLSEHRAQAVLPYLQRRCPPDVLHYAGVGERLSTTGGENEARQRAVSILRNQGVLGGDEFRIVGTPPPPSPLTTHFWIKYCGSGAGGELVTLEVATFIIRDGHDYWQKYLYYGAGAGGGAPIGFGDGLPPGRGWVEFTTGPRVTVSDFEGSARLTGGGAQIGPAGLSVSYLTFGSHRSGSNRVRLETGSGFGLGASSTFLSHLDRAGGRYHSRNWDLY